MLKLTIDSQPVEIEEGATILEVATRAGIYVPTLCYNRELSQAGSCRVCVVEIAAEPESITVAACSYPAAEGMAISTKSEKALKARKLAVELLLARQPHSEKLTRLAHSLGIGEPRFTLPADECILCRLCVRTCQEVVGAGAITFIAQGLERENHRAGVVWNQEKCIACGACAYICPSRAVTLSDNQGKRVIETPSGRMEFALKACASCGNYFAAEKELAYMAKSAKLPIEKFDLCPDCRKI